MMAIRVLIVDDQELIRTGFALILDTAEGIEVVGSAADGREALKVIESLSAEGHRPDVVLMDVRMPGMNGIDATAEIAKRDPRIAVIVLTTFDLDEYAFAAIEAGASGFLLKDARATELIEAVRAVAEGNPVMVPKVTHRLMLHMREQHRAPNSGGGVSAGSAQLDSLTDREREVFALVAEGLSNAEIGERLFLSESTVKTHVGRVLSKLELRDRVHAVILAYEAGIR